MLCRKFVGQSVSAVYLVINLATLSLFNTVKEKIHLFISRSKRAVVSLSTQRVS